MEGNISRDDGSEEKEGEREDTEHPVGGGGKLVLEDHRKSCQGAQGVEQNHRPLHHITSDKQEEWAWLHQPPNIIYIYREREAGGIEDFMSPTCQRTHLNGMSLVEEEVGQSEEATP